MKFYNKNFGINPSDPEYDNDYDAEEAYERYLDAVEEREEERRHG